MTLWEEFSAVLLLPPCGKFEDQYIHFNAVDCYWTQKQERSNKSALRCFLRANSGRAGSEVLLTAFAMCPPLLSALYVKLMYSNSHIAMPVNSSRHLPCPGWHWPLPVPVSSLCLCERKTVASIASAAACRSWFPSRPTCVLAALLWKGQKLPVVAVTGIRHPIKV